MPIPTGVWFFPDAPGPVIVDTVAAAEAAGLAEIWLGDDVIKSVARTTKGEIRKKRAQRPTITNRRQGSPEKDPSTVN